MTSCVVLLGLLVLVISAAVKWRQAVKAALLFTVFEGALRKWVFPGASEYIYFVKDFLLLGAYLGYFRSDVPRPLRLNSWLTITIGLSCAFVVLGALNPNLGSVFNGIYGVKAYLWYVPLFWILPAVIRDRKEFYKFTQIFIVLAVLLGLLAARQFEAPLDSSLNKYAGATPDDESLITGFGEDNSHAMVTGSFSYVAGYTSFLMFTLCLIVPNLAVAQRQMVSWGYAAVMALLLGNMCMAGGRKSFIFLAICLITLVLLSLTQRRIAGALVRCLVLGAVATLLAFGLFGDAVNALIERSRSAEDFGERTQLFIPLVKEIPKVGVLGYGTGVSLAERSGLAEKLHVPAPKQIPPYIDFEPHQILYELGPIGFLVWHAMKIALAYALWRTGRKLRDPKLKILAYCAFSFHIAHFYLGTYLNHIANIYFWFFSGFILLLPKLDKQTPLAPVVSRKEDKLRRLRRGRYRPENKGVPAAGVATQGATKFREY